jgi:DNA replication protein DnaC
MKNTDPSFDNACARLRDSISKRHAQVDAILAGCDSSIPCPVHGSARPLSRELSNRENRAAYAPCPTCQAEQAEAELVERIHRAGVPLILCKATLENWQAQTETDEAHLDRVRAFIRARRGFLVMLGDLGTGKSHVAAAITRNFKHPLFVKQSEMLRRLRSSYRDKAARDPVDEAQDADLLVLDEMGLSAGGRDELPMLHDVLDHRYNERKPTVLTGNITFDEMQDVVGARMADRFRESAFAVLMFGGSSHRRDARERYFNN